jgi:excisionase family DNA binding protein
MKRNKERQGKLLSIGEVADRLQVSPDVARSLVDSGELSAVRTPGGHRKVRPNDLGRLETTWEAGARRPAKGRSENRDAGNRASTPSGRQDRAPTRAMDFELREAIAAEQAEAREAAAAADRLRLAELKKTGARIAQFNGLSPEWHAKVIEQLERSITPERVPTWVSQVEAEAIVKACVDKVVAEYWEATARLRDKERARQHGDWLITYGRSYAATQTTSWDEPERGQARREAERALREEVRPDWTEADAKDLVDDVLAEFEEEDPEDEEENEFDEDDEEVD